MYSLMSASIIHSVARACKNGELYNCGCSGKKRPRSLPRDWLWQGCGDNTAYGYKFSVGFADAVEREKNHPRKSKELARMLMNLHNNEAGRRVSECALNDALSMLLDGQINSSPFYLTGSVHVRKAVVQVSRSVRLVQPQDMLAPTALLQRDGSQTAEKVRLGCGGSLQQAGHQSQSSLPAQEQADQGGPCFPYSIPQLLQEHSTHWPSRHPGQGVQSHIQRHRLVQEDVLQKRLRDKNGGEDGEVLLQVPILLLRQVQDVRGEVRSDDV